MDYVSLPCYKGRRWVAPTLICILLPTSSVVSLFYFRFTYCSTLLVSPCSIMLVKTLLPFVVAALAVSAAPLATADKAHKVCALT
jgi:cytochrome b subunit of formate dehydrogenase